MMWDNAIPTDGEIGANRHDICFGNNKTNTCISFTAYGNIARKQAEKLAKYSDLRMEVSRMWQCRTVVAPAVLGALGSVHAVLHGGWTLFQVITSCRTHRKHSFLDPVGAYVKSCLMSTQP